MRRTISGLVAAVAVMTAGAAPAYACGFTWCAPYAQGYGYVPTVVGTGCNTCGWGYEAYERLAEPDTQYHPTTSYYPTRQYYYVNQGPTYSGPGMFAPYPTYQENALGAYAPYHYGWHRHHHHGYRYGHAPRHYGYMRHGYGHPLRRYD
jgi:hypothetical protein